jgi:hypothetical protein
MPPWPTSSCLCQQRHQERDIQDQCHQEPPAGPYTVPNKPTRGVDRVPVLHQDHGTSIVNFSISVWPSQPSRGFKRGWEMISDGHLPNPPGQKSGRWVEELPGRLGALINQPGGVEGRSRLKSSDTKHPFRPELARSSRQNLIQPAIPRRSLRIGVAVKAYLAERDQNHGYVGVRQRATIRCRRRPEAHKPAAGRTATKIKCPRLVCWVLSLSASAT